MQVSKDMLAAARGQEWDTLTDLDSQRRELLTTLPQHAHGISESTLDSTAKLLKSMDSEIVSAVQAAKTASADELKLSRSNRAGVNKYLEESL